MELLRVEWLIKPDVGAEHMDDRLIAKAQGCWQVTVTQWARHTSFNFLNIAAVTLHFSCRDRICTTTSCNDTQPSVSVHTSCDRFIRAAVSFQWHAMGSITPLTSLTLMRTVGPGPSGERFPSGIL